MTLLQFTLAWKKTWEPIVKKYYRPPFQRDIESYVKNCNICLTLKIVYYQLYIDLQSLSILNNLWKDIFIVFVIGLLIPANWKSDTYNSILVIVDRLIKIIYYEPLKIIIDVPGLAKKIINVMVYHHEILKLIIIDPGLLIIS